MWYCISFHMKLPIEYRKNIIWKLCLMIICSIKHVWWVKSSINLSGYTIVLSNSFMYDEFVEISFVWNLLRINLMASNTIYHVRCSCYGCYWELVGVCVSVFPRIPWNKLDKTKSQMIIAHAIQLIAFVLHRSSFDTTSRYYQGSWST